jgi:hypothetical protein
MPFATQPNLPPNPSVRIFFIGLNILTPAANNTCKTFVHRTSPGHTLLIETRRKRPGKPDVLMMRRQGPLTTTGADPTNTHGLLIRTAGLVPSQKGVKAYDGTTPSTEGTKFFDSFDMSDIMHVPPGAVSPCGGQPSILIDHGVFYTADKVPMHPPELTAQLVKKTPPGTPPKVIDLAEIPTIIGANIYLDPQVPGQQVTLLWRQNGQDVHLDLKPSPNFTYEIYVINEPLFEEDSPTGPSHDEFEQYFQILPGVPQNQQFKLVINGTIPDRGTTRAPCMSVLLSE